MLVFVCILKIVVYVYVHWLHPRKPNYAESNESGTLYYTQIHCCTSLR